MVTTYVGATKQWNSRRRRKCMEHFNSRRHQREYFMKLSVSKLLGSTESPLVSPQRLRCKFVLRFGVTNRNPQPTKTSGTKNTVGPNEFTDFEDFCVEHLQPCKTMFHKTLIETPRFQYYSYNQPLYEPYDNNAQGHRKAMQFTSAKTIYWTCKLQTSPA